MLMEVGVCITVPNGSLFVWAHIDITEVTFVQVGRTGDINKASSELNKKECEQYYPGLWVAVENKIYANIEVDDGI